jgi:hypothetical protein
LARTKATRRTPSSHSNTHQPTNQIKVFDPWKLKKVARWSSPDQEEKGKHQELTRRRRAGRSRTRRRRASQELTTTLQQAVAA